MPFDLDFVRSQFPAFSGPADRRSGLLRECGRVVPLPAVVDRLHRFYTERKVQPYAPYPASQAGGAEMDEARDAAGGA